ncbi:unnamed protein product [Adineta ricciae]|uniref:Large ribosomal subunit protein uL23m n=1 Tax=Adineta ricciae TaxID=249248 RepID=A0A813RPB7_ADIRI|nr:unnamed protein product [Adineta ricciae]CAF1096085.1 unnamed protein product [Adineta ricciae]
MRLPANLQYLYKSMTPRYPKWQPGDPTHRIFFPQFWMRIVRPEENRPLRHNVVRFECHIEMTKNDIKQYLEKLYKIETLDITTIIKQGKENRHPVSSEIIDPDPDRKFAYVFLKNETFTYPDIWRGQKPSDEFVKDERRMQTANEKQKATNLYRPGLSTWFR